MANFQANGLIETRIDLVNIKKNYYNDLEGYFRLAFEILLAALLVFYFLTEVTEIFRDIV